MLFIVSVDAVIVDFFSPLGILWFRFVGSSLVDVLCGIPWGLLESISLKRDFTFTSDWCLGNTSVLRLLMLVSCPEDPRLTGNVDLISKPK